MKPRRRYNAGWGPRSGLQYRRRAMSAGGAERGRERVETGAGEGWVGGARFLREGGAGCGRTLW